MAIVILGSDSEAHFRAVFQHCPLLRTGFRRGCGPPDMEQRAAVGGSDA
jgi:hypothetical protein